MIERDRLTSSNPRRINRLLRSIRLASLTRGMIGALALDHLAGSSDSRLIRDAQASILNPRSIRSYA